MRDVGRRDPHGLEYLYRQHAAATVRIAYLMTGDQQLAEDLTQDAFIKAAGRLAHVRNPNAFGAYLRKTVMNLAKMHFRRKEIERKHNHSAETETSMEAASADADLLRHGLAVLTYRQRAAIVLRYYLDLPDSKIASELGCSEGTVRSLISRGTARMREAMGADHDG